MKFVAKVRVYSSVGRFLHTVGPDRAKVLLNRQLAKVRTKRRGTVVDLEVPPSPAPTLGGPRGSAAVGKSYVEWQRFKGMRVFRHRERDILGYQATFLAVPESVGATLLGRSRDSETELTDIERLTDS